MPESSSQAIDVDKIQGDSRSSLQDSVAVEEPLEIQLVSPTATGAAARSISITMRTPGHDAELALGFLFSENVIQHRGQVAAVSTVGQPAPGGEQRNTVRVELLPEVAVDLERLARHFYTTSSCGVCGKASVDALRVTGLASLQDKGTTYSRKFICDLPDRLLKEQRLFSQTGGLHAAAVFDEGGEFVVVREDVGRHNAVDKVVGALLLQDRLPAHDLGVLVSGRASFELMQKTLVAGIPTLVAVSAPSSLAVTLAREFDMTLIGFLRGEKFNVYAGEHRIA